MPTHQQTKTLDMHIAITGPHGFVGSRLQQHLKTKHQCQLLSRQKSDSNEQHQINYDDFDSLINATKDCDTVIHLGGMAHLPQNTEEAQNLIHKSNVTNTLELAKAAKQNNCKRFIYISSIKVNGEATHGSPYKHNDTPKPEDFYGLSKLNAENALKDLCADSAMELTIIRPGLVYGPNNKGNLATLERLIKWRTPLPLGNLKNKRSLVHIDSLCSIIEHCCTHPAAAGEIFLAADPTPLSTGEICKLLAKLNNLPQPIIIPFPPYILKLAASKLNALRKLTENLEIDTQHTEKTLQFSLSAKPSLDV